MNDEGKFPLISVIVPVYNVQKYLRKCMESLLNQTYRNYEIILIDDGSTDNSGKMCDDYEDQYKNVNIIHQSNEGLSAARNSGVRLARGEYITFVDSDDYVTENYLIDLYALLKYYDADMAILSIYSLFDNTEPKIDISRDVISGSECLRNVEVLKDIYYRKIIVTACGKIYKKQIVQKCEFPIGLLYEDQVTTYKMVDNCSRIAVSNKIGYFYIQRSGSITHTPLQWKDFKTLDVFKEQIEFINNKYPELHRAVVCKYADLLLKYIYRLTGEKEKEYIFFSILKKEMGKIISIIIFDIDASWRMKIKCSLVFWGYRANMIVKKAMEYLQRS